jgi:hypothetical protein
MIVRSAGAGKVLAGLPSEGDGLEARAGIEPAIEVLQTSALPLGYRANPL